MFSKDYIINNLNQQWSTCFYLKTSKEAELDQDKAYLSFLGKDPSDRRQARNWWKLVETITASSTSRNFKKQVMKHYERS